SQSTHLTWFRSGSGNVGTPVRRSEASTVIPAMITAVTAVASQMPRRRSLMDRASTGGVCSASIFFVSWVRPDRRGCLAPTRVAARPQWHTATVRRQFYEDGRARVNAQLETNSAGRRSHPFGREVDNV